MNSQSKLLNAPFQRIICDEAGDNDRSKKVSCVRLQGSVAFPWLRLGVSGAVAAQGYSHCESTMMWLAPLLGTVPEESDVTEGSEHQCQSLRLHCSQCKHSLVHDWDTHREWHQGLSVPAYFSESRALLPSGVVPRSRRKKLDSNFTFRFLRAIEFMWLHRPESST